MLFYSTDYTLTASRRHAQIKMVIRSLIHARIPEADTSRVKASSSLLQCLKEIKNEYKSTIKVASSDLAKSKLNITLAGIPSWVDFVSCVCFNPSLPLRFNRDEYNK